MKKSFLLMFLIISLQAAEVQEKLSMLLNNPIPNYTLEVKYDPFIKSQGLMDTAFENTMKVSSLQINSILNNKVYIESKWRSEGDEVQGYKIIKINQSDIVTSKDGKLVKFELQPSTTLLKVRKIEK